MVAKINSSGSVLRMLNYNEQKCSRQVAKCIHAANYLKDAGQMNFYEKLNRLQDLINRNNSKTNSVHISLNFSPGEKLDEEKLTAIASEYMKRIGFSEQPYLVYEHLDSGHPHLHIVTTNIKQYGTRISLHNIGRHQSEKARQELEIEFGLVKASEQKPQKKVQQEEIIAPKLPKINYGKSEVKRSIINVLDAVLNTYNYTSLPELNAILRLYNIQADRGEKESRIYRNNGLIYHVLDKAGKPVGVPIKASSIYSKPTSKNLEEKFKENKLKREPLQRKTRTMVNWALKKNPQNLPELISMLKEEKITAVVRQNEQGIIYGITYVDHRNKSVFNGSDLGKAFSAKAVLEKIGLQQVLPPENMQVENQQEEKSVSTIEFDFNLNHTTIGKLFDIILSPTYSSDYLPYELRKTKKKKTRGLRL